VVPSQLSFSVAGTTLAFTTRTDVSVHLIEDVTPNAVSLSGLVGYWILRTPEVLNGRDRLKMSGVDA
jgi:hypothetical protein